MKQIFILIIFIILIAGQINAQKKAITLPLKPLTLDDSLKIKADTLLKKSKPVMGYRFVIVGDFDGDHKTDTLLERYTDSLFQTETPKYFDNPDTNFGYEQIIFLNGYLNRQSFLEWEKLNLKLEGGQLGFHYIENCGDINKDGKDEILLVRQWSDWSNVNTAHIYTLYKNNWKEIYSTPAWEWQFPPTPSACMIPCMFGDFQFDTTQNDSIDKELETNLKSFKFLKYYSDGSVEFSGMNPINIWDNEKAHKEFDSIGDQEYFLKHFDKVYINDSVYIRDKKNPSIHYKVIDSKISETENVILFGIDDPTDMVTTRIYIDNPKSPFRNKQKK